MKKDLEQIRIYIDRINLSFAKQNDKLSLSEFINMIITKERLKNEKK